MSKTRHTPGPWRATKLGGSVQDDTGKVVAFVHDDVSAERRKANADLIAGAPEMLRELSALAFDARQVLTLGAPAHRESFLALQERIEKAETIIAKAKGTDCRMTTTQTKPNRSILRYHGGKWNLAEWIIQFFPPHHIYVEPCGGAASVLLQKSRSHGEVYNDLDSEVVNVFRVVRDVEKAKDLEQGLKLTPYSREEFRMSYEDIDDPVEMARRTIVRSFQGFTSASVTKPHKTGFRSNANRNGTTPARDWAHYPQHIVSFVERLAGVVIENREALEVINQHDSPETLFYVDPPYVLSTRYAGAKWNDCYRHEMTENDHRRLAEKLHSVKGMVVLSGYRSALYDQELYQDWQSVECKTYGEGAKPRTEVLWLNPLTVARSAQRSLFESVMERS